DGKFLVYSVMPQEGDGEIVVRNLATGAEWRQPRGGRASPTGGAPKAGAGEGQGVKGTPPDVGAFFGGPFAFTADRKRLGFPITPTNDEAETAKKENKADAVTKPALGGMDLATGKVTRIEGARSCTLSDKGGNFLFYQRESKAEASKEEKKTDDEAGDEFWGD